jgi:hypothetical protein
MSHIEASTIKNNFTLWQAVGLSGDQELAEHLLDRGFYRIPMDKFNTVKQILKEAEVNAKYQYLADKVVTKPHATHFSVLLKPQKKKVLTRVLI